MRLAVYTDYTYHRVDGQVYADRAFALFLAEVARHVERLDLIGRVHPGGGPARYPLGGVELIDLPHYESLAEPREAARAMPASLRAFWRTLGTVDAVWLLGPHPLVFPFALLAALRRKRIALGVRQEFIDYVASRHPRRPLLRVAARAMELAFRALAMACPTVVVGPEIARTYRHSRALLQIVVSVVPEADVVTEGDAKRGRSYDGEISILSVGRLDAEKNPLALADVLGLLNGKDPRWSLRVCGEGPMSDELRNRLDALGQSERSELLGYVPHDDGLRDLYLGSDVLLHVSWTEGVPQVMFEAYAAGLPVVATDVGGVRESSDGAALLISPGDPAAAAGALERLAADESLRTSLVSRGIQLAKANSMEAQAVAVAGFLATSKAA